MPAQQYRELSSTMWDMGKLMDVAQMGKKGGLASAANLTPAERSERARKAVKARWDKAKARKGKKKGL